MQAAIDETLKLERAISQLRTEKRVVVTALRAGRRNRSRRAAGDLPVPWDIAVRRSR